MSLPHNLRLISIATTDYSPKHSDQQITCDKEVDALEHC